MASSQTDTSALKNLSLEELSQIEVTTPSKAPGFRPTKRGRHLRHHRRRYPPFRRHQHSGSSAAGPGVEVARIDGNKWSIGIRGFGSRLSRSVLVLIDGRTVYTTLFAGTYWEVQDTVMDDIDRIEVIRGPGGTIWGPNAVNGVINIITKDSKDTRGAWSSAGGGNEEQGFANFRYGGGNGKDFNYRVYGKGFTRGPEISSATARISTTGEPLRRVSAWTGTRRPRYLHPSGRYLRRSGRRECQGHQLYAAVFADHRRQRAISPAATSWAAGRRTFSDGNDLQFQAYYDRTNRHEPNFGELRNTFDVDFLQRLQLPRAAASLLGLGRARRARNDLEVVSGLRSFPTKRTDYLLTAFVQDEIGLVEDRLALDSGNQIAAHQLHRRCRPGAERPASVDARRQANRLGGVYSRRCARRPTRKRTSIFRAISRRRPDGTPVLRALQSPTPTSRPNSSTATNWATAACWARSCSSISPDFTTTITICSARRSRAPLLRKARPRPAALSASGAVPQRTAAAYTKGVEIAPEWRPASSWRLRGSYSYLHMNMDKGAALG